MICTSWFDPIGGHVHLDVPQSLSDARKKQATQALALFGLTLLASENKRTNSARSGIGSYGGALDFRWQKNGSTLEWRTPSAEWICSEKSALCFLATTATLWHACTTKEAEVKKIMAKLKIGTIELNALRPLVVANRRFGIAIFKASKEVAKLSPFYEEWKEEVDLALSPGRFRKLKEKSKYELGHGWKLQERGSFPAIKKLMDKDIRKTLTGGNSKQTFKISWNPDINVGAMAEVISNTFSSLKYTNKNQYILFGLKNPFDSIIAIDNKWKIHAGESELLTKTSASKAEETFKKLFTKAKEHGIKTTEREFNAITGEFKELQANKLILIGIPRSLRDPIKALPLVRLIQKIETNRSEPVKFPNIEELSDAKDDEGPEGETEPSDINGITPTGNFCVFMSNPRQPDETFQEDEQIEEDSDELEEIPGTSETSEPSTLPNESGAGTEESPIIPGIPSDAFTYSNQIPVNAAANTSPIWPSTINFINS